MSFVPKFPDDFLGFPIKKYGTLCDVKSYRSNSKSLLVYVLNYEAAKKYVATCIKPIRVKSQYSYLEWSRMSEFPLFLPTRPYDTYKGKGWVSWGIFLGTGNLWIPKMYAGQTQEDIDRKKNALCSLIEIGDVSELEPIYQYIKFGDSVVIYEYIQKYKHKINSIVRAYCMSKNMPSPKNEDLEHYRTEVYHDVLRIIDGGRFFPEKLIKRAPLYSWMATINIMLHREEFKKNGGKRVSHNDITERYNKELHHYDEDFELNNYTYE